MNFAGCGQCHEPEGKFPRARLGVMARDVTFEYFKRQIYQHYERWPKGTMPLYSPERFPEVVLREVYTWLVDELGLRPWIAGSLAIGHREGDKTSVHADRVEQRRKRQGAGGRRADGLRKNPCGLLGGRGSRNGLRGHDAAGEARARTSAADRSTSAR